MPVSCFHCGDVVKGEAVTPAKQNNLNYWQCHLLASQCPLAFSSCWQIMFRRCQLLAFSYWRPRLVRRLASCKSAFTRAAWAGADGCAVGSDDARAFRTGGWWAVRRRRGVARNAVPRDGGSPAV